MITGGPGTGKTTLVNAVVEILEKKNRKILLAAPTGRAARRLGDLTGRAARTIHRMLEFSPRTATFERNPARPLDVDVLVLDEVSMVDIVLFHHVLKALPPHCQLVLVGDVDQLPSVGPGNVLRGPDPVPGGGRGPPHEDLPPGRGEPDHHQRPPRQPRGDAGPHPGGRRGRLPLHREGGAARDPRGGEAPRLRRDPPPLPPRSHRGDPGPHPHAQGGRSGRPT